MERHRSKVESYAHFVWRTKGGQTLLTPQWEPEAYASIVAEARRLRCEVIAIGGLPDHVHLLVRMPATLAPATLAKQVKGVSSSSLNQSWPEFEQPFHWQDGYGCFSIGRSQIPRVAAYIDNQKRLHAERKIWPEWEATSEVVHIDGPDTDAG